MKGSGILFFMFVLLELPHCFEHAILSGYSRAATNEYPLETNS